LAETRRQSVAYTHSTATLIGLCFILSGATGLIYEVLWARMLGLVFGATTLAVSTVLAAFMSGLALGSALAGRVASRINVR
jgi:spermidine synthase